MDTPCPTPGPYRHRMRSRYLDWLRLEEETLVASFGEARLVRKLDGELELKNASPNDRTRAKEWISLFMHEAVPQVR